MRTRGRQTGGTSSFPRFGTRTASVVAAAAWLLAGVTVVPGVNANDIPVQLAQQGAIPGYDPMRRGLGRPGRSETSPPGNPELGGLPDAPGAEETYYLCSACHSIALVTQQRVTDERWSYLWDWMVREHDMPDQDKETRAAILGYLQAHFSSER